EQKYLRRAAAELRENVIATSGPREPRHASADLLEPARQLGAAAINRRLVRRRRFDRHERLNRVEQPLALAATEIAEIYNRGHGARVARSLRPLRTVRGFGSIAVSAARAATVSTTGSGTAGTAATTAAVAAAP